ncbi:hypothetical protein DPMN_081497 [Dreissena polymorpha]|uniref:Uncharacterized protein n=1 Tax=Dreissena polymorpha TaxID=45954 RepID=A0A9D4BHU4_DREPO|nr:hypothetical protein DPMN_081497 [Dreissena polymorpha]
MAERLDDQDFGLDIFQAPVEPRSAGGKEERIVKDLSKLSQKEKLNVEWLAQLQQAFELIRDDIFGLNWICANKRFA